MTKYTNKNFYGLINKESTTDVNFLREENKV